MDRSFQASFRNGCSRIAAAPAFSRTGGRFRLVNLLKFDGFSHLLHLDGPARPNGDQISPQPALRTGSMRLFPFSPGSFPAPFFSASFTSLDAFLQFYSVVFKTKKSTALVREALPFFGQHVSQSGSIYFDPSLSYFFPAFQCFIYKKQKNYLDKIRHISKRSEEHVSVKTL